MPHIIIDDYYKVDKYFKKELTILAFCYFKNEDVLSEFINKFISNIFDKKYLKVYKENDKKTRNKNKKTRNKIKDASRKKLIDENFYIFFYEYSKKLIDEKKMQLTIVEFNEKDLLIPSNIKEKEYISFRLKKVITHAVEHIVEYNEIPNNKFLNIFLDRFSEIQDREKFRYNLIDQLKMYSFIFSKINEDRNKKFLKSESWFYNDVCEALKETKGKQKKYNDIFLSKKFYETIENIKKKQKLEINWKELIFLNFDSLEYNIPVSISDFICAIISFIEKKEKKDTTDQEKKMKLKWKNFLYYMTKKCNYRELERKNEYDLLKNFKNGYERENNINNNQRTFNKKN